MLNKQTVCGILWPREWQKYLRASEKLSTLLQPGHIRSPFDSHTEKETVSSGFPLQPLASLLSRFLSFFFFFDFFVRQALKLGGDTRLVVSMAWIMLVLLLDRVFYWCVWHSKWEIFSNLARLSANSLHFLFLTGSRIRESLKECHFFSSLCSLSQRPFALNLLTALQNTTQGWLWRKHSALLPLSQAQRAQVLGIKTK